MSNFTFLCRFTRKAGFLFFAAVFGLTALQTPSRAQTLISNLSNSAITLSSLTNSTYTQDFNSLVGGNNGSLATLASLNTPALRGLQIARSGGTNNTSNIIADDGTGTAGSIYSYGTQSAPNRRFGTLTTSASTGDLYYGFRFVNDTSDTILSMNISFIGEVWRAGQANLTETLEFSSAVFNAGSNNLGSSGYSTAGTELQFAKQVGSVVGSQQPTIVNYRETKTGTVTFAAPVASGQEVWIRWKDTDIAGVDNGMSIDDLRVSFNPTPAPPAVLSALIGSAVGGTHFVGTRWRNRRRKKQA